MNRLFVGLGLALVLSCAASGQSPQSKPVFDAADVHVRPRGSNANPSMSGGVLRSGRYDIRNATMVDFITLAYGVDSYAVLGGPNWLELDRFDIAARASQATSPDDLKQMLQALLVDRFKLQAHTDTRPQPVYALGLGTGKHKMKEPADSSAPGDCEPLAEPQQPGATPQNLMRCHNVTMEVLAQFVAAIAGAYVPGAPVVDVTGLKGGWDFDLRWTQRALLAQAGSDGISMADALDRQLGLKLESRTMPRPVLVVDAANEKPTANAADIERVLPSKPPAEFEVASIKPSDPSATGGLGRIQPGGRLDLQNITLKDLMTLAWDINDDELIAAPKFAESARFNITARVSTSALSSDSQNLDIDDVRLMLQALLTERFKLKTHVEERPVSAWVLSASGPKLAKADAANRTGWKNGVPAAGARDPRTNNPIVSRLVTCQNMSMAQLADALPRMAPGYLRTPVVDSTGIEGSFDFSFTFTPNGVGGIGGRGGDGGAPPAASASAASDPTGAISLPDALRQQLGLRLEMQKRPLPVLVIDHAEEKPIDD